MRVRNKKTISNKVGAVEQIFTQPVEKTAKWHFFLYFNIPSILVSIPVVLRFFGVIYSAEICQLQLIIGKSEKWSFQSNPHLEDFKDFLIQILKIYLNVNLKSSTTSFYHCILSDKMYFLYFNTYVWFVLNCF